MNNNIYSKNQCNALQPEFDFMKEIREQEKKPKAELKYFENPKNDNELLFNYQKEFYDGNEQAFWKMWMLSEVVVLRIIRGKIRRHPHKYTQEEIEDKKGIAVEYVLRRFKYETGYCVTTNWIDALKCGVKHALEYQTKADRIIDFVDWDSLSNYEWSDDE